MKNVIVVVVLLTFLLGNKIAIARETSPLIPLAPVTAQATEASSNEQLTDTAPKKKRLTTQKTLKRAKGRRTGRRTGRRRGRRTGRSRMPIRPKAKVTFSV